MSNCNQKVLGAAPDDSLCMLRPGHKGLCKSMRMVVVRVVQPDGRFTKGLR